MNQESTCSVHQNKVFCFRQRVVQINQGYVGQQCPCSVYLGDLWFLHFEETPASLFDLKSFALGEKQAKDIFKIHPLSRLWFY